MNESTLLLDIGNSRLKWALLSGSHSRAQPFAAQGAMDLGAARADRLRRLLVALERPARVYVCNVAGDEPARAVRAAVRRAGLRAPRFVRSEARFGAVRNGYRDPWRLGVDRWVGLIGARSELPDRGVCIVGLGTAMTIDLLAADGRHRGGCIVPGPQLMIRSLLDHTAGIRRRAGGKAAQRPAPAPSGPFRLDTREGLRAGAACACAALIDRAASAAAELLGRRPRLIIAGGGADPIVPLLRTAHERRDDLVLRGLAVIACRASKASRLRR